MSVDVLVEGFHKMVQHVARNLAIAGIFATLCGSALAFQGRPAAPAPVQVRILSDWAAVCDNGARCTAASLPIDGGNEDSRTLQISMVREAGPNARPTLTINTEDSLARGTGTVRLSTDQGVVLASGISRASVVSGLRLTLTPAHIAAMRAASTLTLSSESRPVSGTTILSDASLNGFTAVGLYFDEAQGRLGNQTAMVRVGRSPASAVPQPRALPVIIRPRASSATPLRMNAAEHNAAYNGNECSTSSREISYSRLDANATVAIIPCELAAYNSSELVYIGRMVNGRAQWRSAQFDDARENNITPSEGPVHAALVGGASYGDGILGSGYKGRGIGDCGRSSTHAWDGQRFRLIENHDMPDCRGSYDWLTNWRATVR